jgi:hypothetical protein
MNSGRRQGIWGWIGDLGVCLALLVCCDAAVAQEDNGGGATPRSKVSEVVQASYAAPDSAPQMGELPPGSTLADTGRKYTYQRYNRGGPTHRMAQNFAAPRQRSTGAPSDIYSPRPVSTESTAVEGEIIPAPGSDMLMQGPPGGELPGDWEGFPDDGHMHGGCHDGHCPVGPCSDCCLLFAPWVWENFSFFGGVQGFKGPPDQGRNGNFGFHEGINWSMPLWDEFGIGYQCGFEVAHSDLSGGVGINNNRTQYFVTSGVFHRPICGYGLQGGAVVDFLHDDFYVKMDLTQVRAEISLRGARCHEIGFWTAVHTSHQTRLSRLAQQNIEWQPTDIFAVFYRRKFDIGATGRLWSGATGNGEAIIGGDATAPLTGCLALQSAFNYRIPKQNEQARGAQESWGLTINLVWYPGYKSPCSAANPYRPLFGVADDTTFFIDQKLPAMIGVDANAG